MYNTRLLTIDRYSFSYFGFFGIVLAVQDLQHVVHCLSIRTYNLVFFDPVALH